MASPSRTYYDRRSGSTVKVYSTPSGGERHVTQSSSSPSSTSSSTKTKKRGGVQKTQVIPESQSPPSVEFYNPDTGRTIIIPAEKAEAYQQRTGFSATKIIGNPDLYKPSTPSKEQEIIYSKGQEPYSGKSITYQTDDRTIIIPEEKFQSYYDKYIEPYKRERADKEFEHIFGLWGTKQIERETAASIPTEIKASWFARTLFPETSRKFERKVKAAQQQESARVQAFAESSLQPYLKETEFKLEGERAGAESRLTDFAGNLQKDIDAGVVSLDVAQRKLKSQQEIEQTNLRVSALGMSLGMQRQFREEVAKEIPAAELRLNEYISEQTFGMGSFGVDAAFLSSNIPESKTFRDTLGILKRTGDELKTKITSDIDISKTKVINLDFKGTRAIYSEKGEKVGYSYIADAPSTFLTYPMDTLRFTGTRFAEGVIRKPVTIGAVTAASFGIGSGIGYAAPSVKLAASQGSLAAKSTILGGKITGIALTTGFVTTSAYKVFSASSVDDMLRQSGEATALAGAAVVGSSLGVKVGAKAFEFKLSRYPTTIESQVTQKYTGTSKYISKSEGIISRGTEGKFKFPFKSETITTIKDTKGAYPSIKSITKVQTSFLGDKLPTGTVKQYGQISPYVARQQAALEFGAVQKFMGKAFVDGKGYDITFDVFKSGKLEGTFGKSFYESNIKNIGSITTKKGTFTMFQQQESITPQKIFSFSNTFVKMFSTTQLGKAAIISPAKTQPISKDFIGTDFGGVGQWTSQITKVPAGAVSVTPKATKIIPIQQVYTPTVPTISTSFLLPSVSRIQSRVLIGSIGRTQMGIDFGSRINIRTQSIAGGLSDFGVSDEVGIGSIPIALSGVINITGTDTITQPQVTPAPIVTPMPPIPPLSPYPPFPFMASLPFDTGGGGSSFSWKRYRKPRQEFKYKPSIEASLFKVKGKKPRFITGIEIRPILNKKIKTRL